VLGEGDIAPCDAVIIFESAGDRRNNLKVELEISQKIFLLLLFQGCGHVVAGDQGGGRILSMQDGYLYFVANTADGRDAIAEASDLLKKVEGKPLYKPEWVLEFNEMNDNG
jgi:hypothetical protein